MHSYLFSEVCVTLIMLNLKQVCTGQHKKDAA